MSSQQWPESAYQSFFQEKVLAVHIPMLGYPWLENEPNQQESYKINKIVKQIATGSLEYRKLSHEYHSNHSLKQVRISDLLPHQHLQVVLTHFLGQLQQPESTIMIQIKRQPTTSFRLQESRNNMQMLKTIKGSIICTHALEYKSM